MLGCKNVLFGKILIKLPISILQKPFHIMYNGIGLQTPRGSGTNGYVQRNLAFVKSKKDRIDYKTEEEINKLDQGLNKQPNREILDHERKRKVELKCMEMQELMEEQGYVHCHLHHYYTITGIII